MGKRIALLFALAGAAPFSAADSASSVLPRQAREMLWAHNAVRATRGLRPLKWSGRLADLAQKWAYVLALENAFTHRPHNRYGENLYVLEGGLAEPSRVVSAWAAEESDYDYDSNSCRGVCGHYTQIVWRDTSSIGCGVARGINRQIWVCNYDPPGNAVGSRPY